MTELSVTLDRVTTSAGSGGSRIGATLPEPELAWTSTSVSTNAANPFGPWRSVFFGWPYYMKSAGRELPLPKIPAVFTEEELVVTNYETTNTGTLTTNYYSGGSPHNKETTRAVCSLTRDGIVVARLYAIGRGFYAHRYSCTATAASNEDPDCVDLIVTNDPEKDASACEEVPAGYYEKLESDIELLNNPIEPNLENGDSINHFKNVRLDTQWSQTTTSSQFPILDQKVSVIFSLGGGKPDLGTYEFVGAVESSYQGATYSWVYAGFGEQMQAYVYCLVFSGYTVVRSCIHGIQSTDAPMNNQWPDLWTTTTAPDVNRVTVDDYIGTPLRGNWILLTCPDGVSQLCILRTTPNYTQHLYFYWSPGGLFSGGAGVYRPTATDEINTERADGEYLAAVNTFYGFKGVRGAEVTSRVLVTCCPSDGHEQALRLLNFEWFVTDIPASIYPRNVCLVSAYSGYYHYGLSKTNGYVRIIMPDGKLALSCCEWSTTKLGDYAGSVDGKYRLAPINLFSNTANGHNYFGYLPDLYWGDMITLSSTPSPPYGGADHTYTFGGIWKKLSYLVFPNFTCAYATNVSDNEAYSITLRTPGKSTSNDLMAPTFAGVTSATAVGDNTIRLTWESGSDDTTASDDLIYEVHYSTDAADDFQPRAVVPGA